MQVWRNICVDLCCHSMYCLPEHTRALHYYTWLLSWFHSVVVSLCFVACFFSVVLAAVYWEAGWSLLSLELLCFALHSPECLHAKQYTSGTVSYLSSSTSRTRLKPEQLLPLPALHSWSCLVSAFGFNKHLRSVTLMACFEQRLTSSRQKRWTSLALHYVTYVTSWAHSVSSCHSLCEWGERGCILPDLHTQNKNRSRSSHCVSGLSQFYFGLITKDCWHITLEYTRDVCTFLLHACRTDNTNISSPQLWRNVSV